MPTSRAPAPAPAPAFRPVIANAGWNLLGNVLPLLAGIAAVPYLVAHLGTERFGLLGLAWILIGYFGLFDFGLGRALTRMVAQRHGGSDGAELDGLCSTGMALGVVAGLAGGVLVAAVAAMGLLDAHVADAALRSEAHAALLIVAVGVLPTVASAVLRGALEGYQRFKSLNAIRVPAGVLLFAAPCVSAAFSPRLDLAVASLVVTRWFLLGALWWLSTASLRLSLRAVQARWVAPMLRFGGWLTVSNIVGPVIVYLDRFVISALLPPAQLAYYTAPFEVVARLLVLPMSLTGALFPALAQAQEVDAAQARALRRRASQLTAATVLPLALLGAVAAEPLLRLWLGADFARHGAPAMQILLVGFAFNALAQIPMVALHGLGLARQTALLHLFELPLYIAALLLLVRGHGLQGAALAWSLRGALDMLTLHWMLHRAQRTDALAQPTPASP